MTFWDRAREVDKGHIIMYLGAQQNWVGAPLRSQADLVGSSQPDHSTLMNSIGP